MRLKALRAAFPFTIPIMLGFLFLGMSYGMLMGTSGFSFCYPLVMSIVIFTGSVEFLTIGLLLGPFHPAQALLISLMVSARHLFYGISMLDRFRGLGAKRLYLIYAMCDETFSVNYTADIPIGVDRGWFMLWVTLLNQSYWVFGSTLGGLIGNVVTFETRGLGFAMTAMFVVIFMEQWLKERNHAGAYIGGAASVACLMLFGPERFILPTMCLVLLTLIALRGRLEKEAKL